MKRPFNAWRLMPSMACAIQGAEFARALQRAFDGRGWLYDSIGWLAYPAGIFGMMTYLLLAAVILVNGLD